tara:strand:- start:25238 stop:25825 length:588 start_codon:yes stop_codon:yes gene_type:complete
MSYLKTTLSTILLGLFLTIGCDSAVDSDVDQSTDTQNSTIASHNVSNDINSTVVRGHQTDDGSIPNGTVNGKYKALYAWDADGNWYFDLGDGRVQGSVGSIDELDESTLTVCDYVVIYRGDFEGTPFLANGWIRNNIKCNGYAYDKAQTFNTLYVHETDRRYSKDLEPIWGSWGILVDTIGGVGNAANPQHPVNN